MLDVHPPHAPTHTWKDFFIHIATIVIGLLIAVGLEQTVEYLHHREQRIRLEEALHVDSQANQRYVAIDLRYTQSVFAWATQEARSVRQADDLRHVLLQPLPKGDVEVPDAGVWNAAKNNGQVSLLSAQSQNWLNDLDRVESSIFVSEAGALHGYDVALRELDLALRGLTGSAPASVAGTEYRLDLSTLSPADRVKMAEKLDAVAEATMFLQTRILTYATYNQYIFTTPDDQLEASGADERFQTIRERLASKYQEGHFLFSSSNHP